VWSFTNANTLTTVAANRMAALDSVRGTRPLAIKRIGTMIPMWRIALPTIAKIRIRFFFI